MVLSNEKDVIVTNKHEKFNKIDYEQLEKGFNDPFQNIIVNEARGQFSNEIQNECINYDEYRYCKFFNLMNTNFKKLIEKIPLELKKSKYELNDFINSNTNKKAKLKVSTANKIRITEDFKKIDEEIHKINDFSERIIKEIKLKRVSYNVIENYIKQMLHDINFNEYTFYYMIIYLLTFSQKGKAKKNVDQYSWELNLPPILNIEIIKTLIELNTSISKKLLLCFDITNITRNILNYYPDIIFNSLILNKLNSKEDKIVLREEQKEWISQIKTLIEKYKKYIIDGDDMKKTYLNNNAGMGAGKTCIYSTASTIFVNEVNKDIGKYNISLEFDDYNYLLQKRIVQLFIVPSKQVALSFGQNTVNYVSTWFYNDNGINVMYNSAPQYKVRRSKKNFDIKHFHYTKEVNNSNDPIVDKFLNVILWHKLHKKKDKLWTGGYDYYKPPTIIFCDPKGAEELIENRYEFERKLGWYFLPIIDEWVATADCIIKEENNHYLKSIRNILKSNIKLTFLLSASINKKEIEYQEMFANCDLEFAPIIPTINSLTEMYVKDKTLEKNVLVHPFSKVPFDKMNESIDSWDFTVYRCITPKVLMKYCMVLKYRIKFNDIRNINSYINTVEEVLNKIKNSNDDIKRNISNLKFDEENDNEDAKTLFLTSSSISDEIYNNINNKLTKKDILKKITSYKSNLEAQIVELEDEKRLSSNLKMKSDLGDKREIDEKIDEKKKLLENDEVIYTFVSNFGEAEVTEKWINENIELTEKQLTVLLSGYDLYFDDEKLDEAAKDIISKPYSFMDTITSMYGRNDHSVKNVNINDDKDILGFKTIMQAFARAGRSGKNDCIVSTVFNESVLEKFNYSETSFNTLFKCD